MSLSDGCSVEEGRFPYFWMPINGVCSKPCGRPGCQLRTGFVLQKHANWLLWRNIMIFKDHMSDIELPFKPKNVPYETGGDCKMRCLSSKRSLCGHRCRLHEAYAQLAVLFPSAMRVRLLPLLALITRLLDSAHLRASHFSFIPAPSPQIHCIRRRFM